MVRGGKTEIMGRDVTVAEVMEEVLKDRIYYFKSGGGLTLSGGECMAQPEFAEARILHSLTARSFRAFFPTLTTS